jgi:hypothetical protein
MMRLEKSESRGTRVEQTTQSSVPKRDKFFGRSVGVEPRTRGLVFFRSGVHHPVAAWRRGEQGGMHRRERSARIDAAEHDVDDQLQLVLATLIGNLRHHFVRPEIGAETGMSAFKIARKEHIPSPAWGKNWGDGHAIEAHFPAPPNRMPPLFKGTEGQGMQIVDLWTRAGDTVKISARTKTADFH